MKSIFEHMTFNIHEARFASLDASWTRTVFPYPHHRIYYITHGQARLILSDRVMSLDEDHVYLLPAFSLVEAICEDRMDQYYIHFQTVSSFANNIFDIYTPTMAVSANEDTKAHFEKVISHYKKNSICNQLTAMGSFQLILAPFFRETSLPDPGIIRFGGVLAFIEEHLTEPITTDILAGLLGINPVYFTNIFSKTLGVPPIQYIIKKRLEKAQVLLTQTGRKIREIAIESGFPNEMYFSRVFREKTGMTPGAYRRRFLKKT